MELLNRLYRQSLDLLGSLTPGGRLLALLLCGVIAVSLAWLVRYRGDVAQEYLLGGQHFSRREIEAMEVAFANQGLVGSEVVGQQIRIPRGRKHEFLAALAKENSLPERFHPEELALEGNLLEPRDVRDQRQRIASQNKLASLIEKMPGIDDASVQIDEYRLGGFPARIEKRAIALVAASGRRPLREDEIRAVRDTVVGYIAGLEREHVTVTDLEAMRAYPGNDSLPSPDAAGSHYANTKRIFEKLWREKITERLATYRGIVVAVNVELLAVNHDEQRRTPIASTDRAAPPRLPIAAGNAPLAVEAVTNTARNGNAPPDSAVADPSISAPALAPVRVTASIDVPRSHYEHVWRETQRRANAGETREAFTSQPTADALSQIEQQTKLTITQAVTNLLPPVGAHATDAPQVIVTTYEDLSESTDMRPPDHAVAWLAAHWQSLAMFLLALVSLWLVRRFVLATRASSDSLVRGDSPSTPADLDDVAVAWTNPAPLEPSDEGPDLREQLRELVNADPDAAAETLRSWIGDAA